MALDKITADKIYEHSMERVANRPTAAARFGTGGLSPAQLKAKYDQLSLDAIDKINELIDKIKAGADGDTILKYMQTPIPGDDDDTPRTLYELLQDITIGDVATYLTLRSLTKTTLWDELHYIEQRLAEATSIQVAKAEAERVAAEKLRETAESGRVSAEQARVVAELGRVAAETTRRNDEQERVTDESGRVAAETARVSAEQARVVAESDRISAENTRETQEQRRQSFEQARQKDEAQRITAEQARAASFAEIIRAKESGELNGKDGRSFAISKIYGSVADMNAGFATDGVELGQFVLIDTGNVEDADNAKLFVKEEDGYSYLTDLSGSAGIEGPEGPIGPAGGPGPIGPQGERGLAYYRLKSNLVGSLEYYPFTDFLIPEGYVPKPYDLVLYNDGNLGYIYSVTMYEKLATVAHIPNVTLKGPTGAPGFSPTVSVSKKDGVATVSITDANGTKTVQIYDGAAGNGTGGSGVPDMAQNDPNGAGYIKNRTHYKETAGAVIFSESSLAFADTLGSFTMAELADSIDLEEGKTYKVSWGGVDYACVAQKDPVIGNGLYLGNGRDINGTTSTEPFLIRTTKEGSYDSSSGKTEVRNYAQTYSIALEISGGEETIYHQLDPRYIPNMYYTEERQDVEILPPSPAINPGISTMGELYVIGDPITLVKGKTYKVTYNGVEYECVAIAGNVQGNSSILLGDVAVLETGTPSGAYPFVIATNDYMVSLGACVAVIALDGSTSITVSILGGVEIIHHIPPKFIKDMYYEEKTELLPETALIFAENDGMMMASVENVGFAIEDGKSYIVIYNGVEYVCEAGVAFNVPVIGNFGALTGGAPTGEPFAIMMADAGMLGVFSLNRETSATMSIRVNVINKIKSKYIDFSEAVPVIDLAALGLPNVFYKNGEFFSTDTLDLKTCNYIRSAMQKGALVFKYLEGNNSVEKRVLVTVIELPEGTGKYYSAFTSLFSGDSLCSLRFSIISSGVGTMNVYVESNPVGNLEDKYVRLQSKDSGKTFYIKVTDDGEVYATEQYNG